VRKEQFILTLVFNIFVNSLQVTGEQETLMAYYYMDDSSKVHIAELFDVSNVESEREDEHTRLQAQEEHSKTFNSMDWNENRWMIQYNG
jgi:hypothetical protein